MCSCGKNTAERRAARERQLADQRARAVARREARQARAAARKTPEGK